MAAALTTFDAMLKRAYPKDLFRISVCVVCTDRARKPVMCTDLDEHCASFPGPEHLAMSVMES